MGIPNFTHDTYCLTTLINALCYFLISSIPRTPRSLSISQKSFRPIYGVLFPPPWFLSSLSLFCSSHGTPILPVSANSWLCLVFCPIPNLSILVLAFLASAARADDVKASGLHCDWEGRAQQEAKLAMEAERGRVLILLLPSRINASSVVLFTMTREYRGAYLRDGNRR